MASVTDWRALQDAYGSAERVCRLDERQFVRCYEVREVLADVVLAREGQEPASDVGDLPSDGPA